MHAHSESMFRISNRYRGYEKTNITKSMLTRSEQSMYLLRVASNLYCRFVVCACLLLSAPWCVVQAQTAQQSDLQQALSAYASRNFNRAWSLLLPLARQGVPEAQRKIGVMYRHGLGVEKNDEKAIYWYHQAAQNGLVRAQNSLGVMYRFGMGVKRNPKEAAHWLQAAAAQGDPKGEENLGLMYLDGDGVQQSDQTAVIWLQKAAIQGQRKAQLTLGMMTLAGRGTRQSNKEGMRWIRQSAQRGSMRAARALAKAYAEGLYGMPKDLDKARYWYQRAGQPLQ